MNARFNRSFRSDEAQCNKITSSRYKKELNFFNESLSYYLELINDIQGKDRPIFSIGDGVIILINIRMIKSIFSSNNLIKTGYYNESYVIQRSIHEAHYLCKYFGKNPDAINKWIKGKPIPHSKISDNLNLSPGVRGLYDMFCNHTHPNLPIILDIISPLRQKKNNLQNVKKIDSVHIGPVYDENEAFIAIFIQLLLLQMIIDNFEDFFVKHNRLQLTSLQMKKHDILHKKFFELLDSWEEYIQP
jgi:hypothetical protein